MKNNDYLSSAEIIIFPAIMDFHQQDIHQFLEEAIPFRFAGLSPLEFEQFITYLFEIDEFDIRQPNSPGPVPGVILAEKDQMKHVIVPLLVSPGIEIDEAWIEKGITATEFHHADQTWLITTSVFSETARNAADEAGIELWDWDVLYDALCQLFFGGKTYEEFYKSHPTLKELPESESELKLKVKWQAAEGVGTEWYNLSLTITNPTNRNIYLHLQLPALIDHQKQQVMADEWIDGEFVAGLIYAGASVKTNALFSTSKLGERPPGGRVVLTCHERLEVPVTYHLEARLKGEACYIITYCYSIHSQEYLQMTLFRDHVLKQSRIGRILVEVYYGISPWLIRIASKHIVIERLLRKVTAILVGIIKVK